MKKKPWLAAILNFVFIGGGTIYNGKRPLLGWLLTIGAGLLLRYEEVRIAPAITGHFDPHWAVAIAGLSMLGIATGIDAYAEARA
jgi:hypothetical protein